MPKKICKHIKVTYYCNSCKKPIKKEQDIVFVPADFRVSDISNQVQFINFLLCKKHPLETTEISYSFYHEVKINNTTATN